MNLFVSETGRYLPIIFANVDKIRVGFKMDEEKERMREIISHARAR